MKGDSAVLDVLNEILTAELTTINQYFVHAKMCENWGYLRLHRKTREAAIGEMKHADEIIERILFLEGLPNLQRLDKLHIGETVHEQLKSDLALEQDAVKRLRDSIALCRDKGDRTSEDLFASILEAEEEHIDWIETQLGLIETLGEKHYLSQQLHDH
jgi:bacterioferritin